MTPMWNQCMENYVRWLWEGINEDNEDEIYHCLHTIYMILKGDE
jgi:hypothetical protein